MSTHSVFPIDVLKQFQSAHTKALTTLAAVKKHNAVSFELGTLEEAGAHFAAETEFGLTYGRTAQRETIFLETLMTKILGGSGSLVVATGQAANVMTLEALLSKPGDELIMTSRGFGGTLGYAQNELPRRQNPVHFADPISTQNFANLVNDKTRAIFVEMVSNSDGVVANIPELARLAKAHNIPLIVDNTLCPLLANPIALGADVVTMSLTKYVNGYDNALGGIITQANFDFKGDPRWPAISGPRGNLPSLAETFNDTAFIANLRQRLTTYGASMDAGTARKIISNMRDLDIRMNKQIENGTALIGFLKQEPEVEWVHHLSQTDHPSYALGRETLLAAPPLMMFKLRGGEEAAKTFLQNLPPQYHRANIGPTDTLIVYPDKTTHRKMSPAQKEAARIGPGVFRLSVGTENVEEIGWHFGQAFKALRNSGLDPEPHQPEI